MQMLEIKNEKMYIINEIECYIYNFNEDKLIIAFKTNDLHDVEIVTAGLLDNLKSLRENIDNDRNLDTSIIKNNLSMFLWDLYVICFYSKGNVLSDIDMEKIYKLEKDKYLARKIVIPYYGDDLSKTVDTYYKYIFPEKHLNRIKNEQDDFEFVMDEDQYSIYLNEIMIVEEFLMTEVEYHED